MAELSLKHIDKIYDNNVQAVFDFNLDVKDGEHGVTPALPPTAPQPVTTEAHVGQWASRDAHTPSHKHRFTH